MLDSVEFEGEGIAAKDISGDQGKILQSMETAMGKLNKELKSSSNQDGTKNNCWGTCTSLAKNHEVDPNGNTGIVDYIKMLTEEFKNVKSGRFGDVVNYTKNQYGQNIPTHGTLFLLKNDEKGTQIFTKNGEKNSQLYMLMYENEMLKRYTLYGEQKGIMRTVKKTTVDNLGVTRNEEELILDKSPFYRSKNK